MRTKTVRRWWKIYRDRFGQYRVSARASNGKKVWASSEGYQHRWDAVGNAIDFGAPLDLVGQKIGKEIRTITKRRSR